MNTLTEISERIKSPTPPFFKGLRKIGLLLAGVGTALLTAPVSMPVIVTTVGGYLLTTGSVLTAISQMAKEDKPA